MPKLNLEQTNPILGIFLGFVRLQIVVAGRYNEYRSTMFRVVERVNVIGTATYYKLSDLPRVTSVRKDIVVRQRH